MGSDEARGRGHLQYPSVGRTADQVYSPVSAKGCQRLRAYSAMPFNGKAPVCWGPE